MISHVTHGQSFMLTFSKNIRYYSKQNFIDSLSKVYKMMQLRISQFSLKSVKREQYIQITEEIQQIVQKTSIHNGFVKIFIPHTTAALTINNNGNSDVIQDLNNLLNLNVPHVRLLNAEGNSDAHYKSSLVGVCLEIPVSKGKMMLGSWQGIFFCEFEQPNNC